MKTIKLFGTYITVKDIPKYIFRELKYMNEFLKIIYK